MVEKELRDVDGEERFYVYLSLKKNLFTEKLWERLVLSKERERKKEKKGKQ